MCAFQGGEFLPHTETVEGDLSVLCMLCVRVFGDACEPGQVRTGQDRSGQEREVRYPSFGSGIYSPLRWVVGRDEEHTIPYLA